MKKILLLLCVLFTFINAQEVVDRVIAVVDDEMITYSEVKAKAAYEAYQRKMDVNDANLFEQVLNSMIDEKLLYIQAELDSIFVEDDQVEAQLDQTLNAYVQQFGSQEAVENTFGMSIEEIKRELREDTRKNLMAQMVQQQKFGQVQASRREVEEFFEEYKDSLGVIPERFKVAHIFINPKADDEIKKKTRALAESILDSIKAGADFAEMAKKYSDDPGSARQGGELGWNKRGTYDLRFEAAIFSLEPGEISEVIESSFGLHIIQLHERRGEAVKARHILFTYKGDDDSELKAIEFLTDLRDSLTRFDKDFAEFAKKYSDDEKTAPFGGELGDFEITQFDKQMREAVYKLDVGEISFPRRLQLQDQTYGYHIIKLLDRTPEHIPDLEEDYQDIKRLADYRKKQETYSEWMDELREKIYWEVRD